jgi:hypothetical protein
MTILKLTFNANEREVKLINLDRITEIEFDENTGDLLLWESATVPFRIHLGHGNSSPVVMTFVQKALDPLFQGRSMYTQGALVELDVRSLEREDEAKF